MQDPTKQSIRAAEGLGPPWGLISMRIREARMKREGQKKGVPDLVLACPRNGYHGLFIELKTAKGRVSPEQSEWLQQLSEQGYRAEVCRGADAAIKTLQEYLNG